MFRAIVSPILRSTRLFTACGIMHRRCCLQEPGVVVLFDSLLHAFAKLRKSTVSFVISVRPRGTNLFPLVGFFVKFCFGTFLKIVEKSKVSCKWGKMSGALHEDLSNSCTVDTPRGYTHSLAIQNETLVAFPWQVTITASRFMAEVTQAKCLS